MKEFVEGTVGIVWMKNYTPPEISVHVWKRWKPGADLSWSPVGTTEIHKKGSPVYEKFAPVMALMHNPQLGAEAFYFSPEEYKTLREGT